MPEELHPDFQRLLDDLQDLAAGHKNTDPTRAGIDRLRQAIHDFHRETADHVRAVMRCAAEQARADSFGMLLGRIYGLLPPEDVKLTDGRVGHFVDPDANETLHRLRQAIAGIAHELKQFSEVVPPPPPGCDRGTMINQNLPGFLEIGMRIDGSLPPGTIEVWQGGKRIGRIENIGLR
jgi:hypothetical protein